jgi:hypothetical protein
LLEPEEEGQQSIMVEITHKDRLLEEIALTSQVFAPEKVPSGGLSFALRIAKFNLQFNFAT